MVDGRHTTEPFRSASLAFSFASNKEDEMKHVNGQKLAVVAVSLAIAAVGAPVALASFPDGDSSQTANRVLAPAHALAAESAEAVGSLGSSTREGSQHGIDPRLNSAELQLQSPEPASPPEQDKGAAELGQPSVTIVRPTVVEGFDWADAGTGAAVALGGVALIGTGLLMVRRTVRRDRLATP
jgi:hypothetical protein